MAGRFDAGPGSGVDQREMGWKEAIRGGTAGRGGVASYLMRFRRCEDIEVCTGCCLFATYSEIGRHRVPFFMRALFKCERGGCCEDPRTNANGIESRQAH